jgi:hypothetical protein
MIRSPYRRKKRLLRARSKRASAGHVVAIGARSFHESAPMPNGDTVRQTIPLSAVDVQKLRAELGTDASRFRSDSAQTNYSVSGERLTIGIANNSKVRALLRRWLKQHNCYVNAHGVKSVTDFVPVQTVGTRPDGAPALLFLTVYGTQAPALRAVPWVAFYHCIPDPTPGNASMNYRRWADARRLWK